MCKHSSSSKKTSNKRSKLPSLISNLSRLFRTLIHLRPRQLLYQLRYRLLGGLDRVGKEYLVILDTAILEQTRKSLHIRELGSSGSTKKIDQIAPVSLVNDSCFRFLNLSHEFGAIDKIDWNYAVNGKLWTYNLNYFEFLRQENIREEEGQALIDDWIAKSTGLKDAWEPYPSSLRLVHWLGFYRSFNLGIPIKVGQSLYNQYRSLWGKVEYHLGANHLLENATALTLGSYFFRDQQAWPKAVKLLTQQLKEQYRPEGAHYELSPMYHIILLWRLLDLYAWLHQPEKPQSEWTGLSDLIITLRLSLRRQLDWLDYLTDEAGNYPHFNDSTAGIAPDIEALISYARSLGLVGEKLEEGLLPVYLYKYGLGGKLWIDLGPLGPNHQPGHGHADHLNFCFFKDGQRIIVDPSISTYENNQRRREERATAYHNTVELRGENSSELWGAFRCGRRAKTRIAKVNDTEVIAEHDGYRHRGITHRRHFSIAADSITITDQIDRSATARLHLAPGLAVKFVDNSWRVGGLQLNFSEGAEVVLEPYEYAAGFNRLLPAQRLSINFQGALTTQIREI